MLQRLPLGVAGCLAAALLTLTPACGSDASGGAGGEFGDYEGWSDSSGRVGDGGAYYYYPGVDAASTAKDAGGGVPAAQDAAPSVPDLPPEQEEEEGFGTPEGTANFVYVPVAGADRVVKVSGASLKVSLVEVGDRPTVMAVVPGEDAVAVINAGSDDLSLLRSTETTDTVLSVPILPHCNVLRVSPKGRWALALYDHGRALKGDPVGSFQAVSVVDLKAAKPVSLGVSVGFRPHDVQFSADDQIAMVITDDGVSVLELAKLQDGAVVAPVAVKPNPLAKSVQQEVYTTPNAMWAVVREAGLKGLRMVHLPTGAQVEVWLPSAPTDLDLVPAGTGALAVLRDTKQVAFVALPGAATKTLQADVVNVGWLTAGLARITDDGKTALLYTSVEGIEQVATMDLSTLEVTPVLLRKTVSHVYVAPGTRKVILIHKPADGPLHDLDPTEAFIDDSEGYTLFDLDTGFTKLMLTPVRVTEIAASTAPDKAFLLLPDPTGVTHRVQTVEMSSFLTEDLLLGSKPEHGRTLSVAGVVAVTQAHPSGRISFIDVNTGKAKTVTGFELNGLVK